MFIFHKTEIQTVILRGLTSLNLNWYKSYDTICKKHKKHKCVFLYKIAKKQKWIQSFWRRKFCFFIYAKIRGGGAITPTLPPSSDGSVTEFIASAESSELLKMVRVHQTWIRVGRYSTLNNRVFDMYRLECLRNANFRNPKSASLYIRGFTKFAIKVLWRL